MRTFSLTSFLCNVCLLCYRRPDSAVHHTGDDYVLGNLKFVPKGETVEVFGMAIPDPLITEAIQQSSYYPKYLKMVAANTKKTPQGSASMQPVTKRATPKKPTTTTPVKQSKPAPSPTKKPSKRKLPQKIRKGKPTFHLVDEEDEAQQESNPQEEGNDPDLELAKKLSLETHQEKGKGEGDDADLELAIKLSLDPALLPQSQAPVGGVTIRDPVSETTPKLHEVVGKGKAVVSEEQVAHSLIDMSKKKRSTDQFILARRDQTPPDSTTGPSSQPDDDTSDKEIHESSSTSDSERTESETETAAPKDDKDQGEVDSSTVTSGVSIPVSDPEKAHEALARPDPEPMRPDWIRLWKIKCLRVARLEQEMSEVKKTDHSADVLASIRSQVPTACQLTQSLYRIKKSKRVQREISESKREQGEEKQDSTYSIRSTDKVDLEEFDLKSDISNTHTPWLRKLQTRLSSKERKHDSDDDEDDDDDEGPSAGSNQGRESDTSATKQHPALTSTGWQITDTRDAGADSSMHRSDPESEHSEQSSNDIPMQDARECLDKEEQ
ncbi:hypothetical protein Tco_1155269 [Tanacetum coccineum]